MLGSNPGTAACQRCKNGTSCFASRRSAFGIDLREVRVVPQWASHLLWYLLHPQPHGHWLLKQGLAPRFSTLIVCEDSYSFYFYLQVPKLEKGSMITHTSELFSLCLLAYLIHQYIVVELSTVGSTLYNTSCGLIISSKLSWSCALLLFDISYNQHDAPI